MPSQLGKVVEDSGQSSQDVVLVNGVAANSDRGVYQKQFEALGDLMSREDAKRPGGGGFRDVWGMAGARAQVVAAGMKLRQTLLDDLLEARGRGSRSVTPSAGGGRTGGGGGSTTARVGGSTTPVRYRDDTGGERDGDSMSRLIANLGATFGEALNTALARNKGEGHGDGVDAVNRRIIKEREVMREAIAFYDHEHVG